MKLKLVYEFSSEAEAQAFISGKLQTQPVETHAVHANSVDTTPVAPAPGPTPPAAAKPRSRGAKIAQAATAQVQAPAVHHAETAPAMPSGLPMPGVQQPAPFPAPGPQTQQAPVQNFAQQAPAAPVQHQQYDRGAVINEVSKIAANAEATIAAYRGLPSGSDQSKAEANNLVHQVFTQIYTEMQVPPSKVSDLPNVNLHDFYTRLPGKMNQALAPYRAQQAPQSFV